MKLNGEQYNEFIIDLIDERVLIDLSRNIEE